jgi:hypothetical protein
MNMTVNSLLVDSFSYKTPNSRIVDVVLQGSFSLWLPINPRAMAQANRTCLFFR